MALAAWPTPGFVTNMGDARAIQVLSEVIKARLMAGLREREGLTYAPDTFVDQAVSQPHYAAVGVQSSFPPAKADAFFAELDAIVADLAKTPIGADELARARTPMVDNSKRGFAFADYWADALAASDSDPAYFEMIRTKVPYLSRSRRRRAAHGPALPRQACAVPVRGPAGSGGATTRGRSGGAWRAPPLKALSRWRQGRKPTRMRDGRAGGSPRARCRS